MGIDCIKSKRNIVKPFSLYRLVRFIYKNHPEFNFTVLIFSTITLILFKSMLYIIKSCIERIFNMDMEIIFPGGKRVDANYKGFIIKTDQAIYNGGENSAPAPFLIRPCLITSSRVFKTFSEKAPALAKVYMTLQLTRGFSQTSSLTISS